MEEERLLVLRLSGRFFERARRSHSSRATQSSSQYAVLLVRSTLLVARPSLRKRVADASAPRSYRTASPPMCFWMLVTLGLGGSIEVPAILH
jgi:hypothetical protein